MAREVAGFGGGSKSTARMIRDCELELSTKIRRPEPMADPWSRPSLDDLERILAGIERHDFENLRETERLELRVPAEVTTSRGNTVAAMTREISRSGIGLVHRGSISPGEVTVRMASETREFEYRVLVEWCHPCENGMFMSGGRFLRKATAGAAGV
jgi:hypothetical protein